MRLTQILTALVVAALIYAWVFEREGLLRFAGRETEAVAEAETAPPPATAAEPPAKTSASGRVPVVTLDSTAGPIDRAVLLRGRTEAARQVTVSAETSGRIVSEPLRKGATVRAGQPLCEIDSGARIATLTEARARLAEAEINSNAATRLVKNGYTSESQVAAAEAAVQAAQAAVAVAEREIDRLTIAAPFEGLLETDTAELGSLMQPGTPCATVIQLDPVKLVGFVPEADVSRIRLGAPAQGRLVSGLPVAGRVTFVGRSADPQTRTFRVEIEVRNADMAIRDGETVEIGVSSDAVVAHLLPASALTLDDSGALGVRVANATTDRGDVAAFHPVTLLRDTTEGVYVSGLPDRVRVIVVGQEYVTDGVPVTVTPAPTGAAPLPPVLQ